MTHRVNDLAKRFAHDLQKLADTGSEQEKVEARAMLDRAFSYWMKNACTCKRPQARGPFGHAANCPRSLTHEEPDLPPYWMSYECTCKRLKAYGVFGHAEDCPRALDSIRKSQQASALRGV